MVSGVAVWRNSWSLIWFGSCFRLLARYVRWDNSQCQHRLSKFIYLLRYCRCAVSSDTHTHKHGSAPTDLEASMARYGEILHLVLSSCYPCSLRRVDLKLGLWRGMLNMSSHPLYFIFSPTLSLNRHKSSLSLCVYRRPTGTVLLHACIPAGGWKRWKVTVALNQSKAIRWSL